MGKPLLGLTPARAAPAHLVLRTLLVAWGLVIWLYFKDGALQLVNPLGLLAFSSLMLLYAKRTDAPNRARAARLTMYGFYTAVFSLACVIVVFYMVIKDLGAWGVPLLILFGIELRVAWLGIRNEFPRAMLRTPADPL